MNIISLVIAWLSDPRHWSGPDGVPALLAQHLEYTAFAVALGAVIAVPLGALIGHTGKGTFLVAGLANGLRALPELGLLTLLVILLGLGLLPVTLALVVMAVPPLLAGTYAGISNVDPAVVDAARGVGMREISVLSRVELPNALPLIIGGLRTAVLQVIATTTIAAYVGLGSLGYYVITGEAVRDYAEMVSGAVLIAVLALVVEGVLNIVQRLIVSPGLRPARRRRKVLIRSLAASASGAQPAGGNP